MSAPPVDVDDGASQPPWVAEVGVAIALGAVTIVDVALAVTYAAARARAAVWPPLDLPSPPAMAATLAIGLLVAGAVALGGRAARRGRVALAALLAVAGVAVLVASWLELAARAVTPASGPVAAAYFALAYAHAGQATVAAAGLAARAARGGPSGLWAWCLGHAAVVGVGVHLLLHIGAG